MNMKTDAITYLTNAIARIESGEVSSESGSHLAGIYGKAANGFERNVKSFVAGLLQNSGIDYKKEICGPIDGPKKLSKCSLGFLIASIEVASNLKPNIVPKSIPGEFSDFIETAYRINAAWVEIKHGDEVDGKVLVLRMKSMLSLLQKIKEAKPNGDD